MKKYLNWNFFAQSGLVVFTMLSFLLMAMKLPAYGLAFNLVAQIFWIYSSYKAWKNANQIGIFINTLIVTIIVLYGVINYWFL